MSWMIVLNTVVMVLCWRWATRDFENGNTAMGWFNIFFSAWNAASIASAVF
jgi:hypothetical protein